MATLDLQQKSFEYRGMNVSSDQCYRLKGSPDLRKSSEESGKMLPPVHRRAEGHRGRGEGSVLQGIRVQRSSVKHK